MEGSTCSSLPEESDGLTEVQASQPQRTLERWEDKHVRLLIESYLQFKGLIGQANTKKSVFDKIAAEFNKHADIKVSGEQCLRKWKKLESKQKEIEDNNKQTGRAHKTWKFHKEMERCIGDKASVRPVFTFDSGSSTSSSTRSQSPQTIDDISDAENASDLLGQRKMKRKRKSYSSASEMLVFLKEYGEKREKVEEEKLNILKTMQEEKKEFFGQLLSCLKDKK
ncbi:unnamed protein product [Porites evermanni]|uniref:Myb/SANT-like DNA-binding domain-containing protein n=1 Tax=Porites evermanni TaxID=104178 RepID=A0ABN8SSU3_9CNID|nr:unnamed protein product [Porites evermanni]